jgi:hypothetical protein
MIYGRERNASENPYKIFLMLAEISVRLKMMITLSMDHSIKTNRDSQRLPTIYILWIKKEPSSKKNFSLLT